MANGKTIEFMALVRIDTPQEGQYYAKRRHFAACTAAIAECEAEREARWRVSVWADTPIRRLGLCVFAAAPRLQRVEPN
ncbi:MAG: hypothetical protein DMG98_27695 [Acidobacteria bacterium]|nr:MAG: hypothetical protein DMG98_27695 [Acidobacteriota bacterium]